MIPSEVISGGLPDGHHDHAETVSLRDPAAKDVQAIALLADVVEPHGRRIGVEGHVVALLEDVVSASFAHRSHIG